MTTVAGVHIPGYEPGWLAWLRRELAPFPGRKEMTLRIVVSVVLVTTISLALQVPELGFSAFFILFVTKENRALTLLTGVIMMAGITIATAISLFLYRFTFDYPELRVPVMTGLIFTGMFLSRVFVIGPLGFVIGFFTALMQVIGEAAPNTDALVRGTLWLWVAVVYPITLTIFVNQVLLAAHPWRVLVGALTQRLDQAAAALERNIREGSAGGQANPALLEAAIRGSTPLLALLHFAESKELALKRRHASIIAIIAASEHLLRATAALEFRPAQPLSAEDLVCAKMLLAEIAQLKAVLPELNPVLGPRKKAVPHAALSQLRELQFAVESFRDGLIRYLPEGITPVTAQPKKRLFIADAFTNPSHLRFALKVTLAAMTCYVIYSGLDWPGIDTAFVTCCFIALENTGATVRKGWLRLSGCAAGGAAGYFAMFFLIPRMESITSLLLLTAAGAALAGWVAAGTDRISYAGLQGAFAFFLCLFQSYAPEINFETVRDRLVGIVLGITVSSLVYRHIWPEHAIDGLRATLARVLRNLGQLLLRPKTGTTIEVEKKAAEPLETAITRDLDNLLRLSELVAIENIVISDQAGPSLSALERMTADTQALCLMTDILLEQAKLEEWQRLSSPVQEAEMVLRASAARQLQHVAAYVETGHCPKSAELESAFTEWSRIVPPPAENDRPRLVRRVIDQVRQYP
jgi:multidrug resistance protein MdtO